MAMLFIFSFTSYVSADISAQSPLKIADNGLYFDGKDLDYGTVSQADTGDKYDFFFGRSISAHGDAVKTYKHFVFMTWYRGGKNDRHVMLTRLNTLTGKTVDIEFPHQHTGFRGNPLIGESHNTIGIAVSPINGTIHMVYDMHAYDNNNHDGVFKDDFFRYSFSIPGAAEVSDEEFTLQQFVKDTSEISQGEDDYKHLVMTGNLSDKGNFARLTYPKFFSTDDGTLLLYMRLGGNNNGAYLFNSYDAATETWSKFTKFNENNQKSLGNEYNWGLYGNMKYLNGKLRIGFQQRSSDNNDKYKYQNGVYYAYSNHPRGTGDWFNHRDESITWPLINSDEIKVFEPGDYITHEQPNSVYIVKDFDWTVTARGDIHTISLVKTNASSAEATKFGFADVEKEQVYIHAYKPAGADEFIIDTEFVGASAIYTSGDNIYIIGLDNGRPYIEVAKGGTNEFTRAYTSNSGPIFTHGTIYINDGVVYFYMQERGTGNATPLYLQIFDLGISQVNVSFPEAQLTIPKGYSELSITALPTVGNSSKSITSVSLFINNNLVSTLDTAPFNWSQAEALLKDLDIGTYQLKAVATDNTDATVESTMDVIVVDSAPTIAFSNNNVELLEGYDEVTISVTASSPDTNRSITETRLYLNDTLVSRNDIAPYTWTFADAALQGLVAGSYTLRAEVTDSENETAEASATITVIDPTPTVSFAKDTFTLTEGYTAFSLNVNATTPVSGRTVAEVQLLVNDNVIRSETVTPYQWGHNADFQAELLNFPVGTHTLKAIVTDSAGLKAEATATLSVQEVVVAPVVTFSQIPTSIQQGYSDLMITASATTPMRTRTIAHVSLFVNDIKIAQVDTAPYQWTDSMSGLASLTAGTYQLRAVATDSAGVESAITGQLVIAAQPSTTPTPTPTPSQPSSDGGSGGSTSLLMLGLMLLCLCRKVIR
ncbi:Ig-like domain-containing protein [Glaciecola sp. HTCC2999]|uniref:Ig-like domain-containing protein n=1 Tax=Glaciecola sp. HTCC2999 TaxID=455436 RepID=UPI0000E1103C|nr:Ig-like domain-containing protein [Glaciecola sp. HTCC2999]